MTIIIGLGNPEKEYLKTRHNIGFMVIDKLHKKLGFEEPEKVEKKFNALVSSGSYNGQKVLLVKPLTFMNLSGEAVGKILQFYKAKPEECLVIYDDLDLALGSLRLRKKGGPGTHNGMKSIVSTIGESFPRLRLGIESRGVTSPAQMDTTAFVLGPFAPEEQKLLKLTLEKSTEAIKTFLEEGIEPAMNRHNT